MLPMQNLSEIVGHNLMTMRKAKGMTQQQIAEKLNYSDKSISKWENGYAVPSVDILKEFAEFYGVTIDFLITEQTDDAVLNAANHEEAVEEKKQQANKAVVIALANVVVLLIFTLVFVSNLISGKLDGMANYMLFLWSLPACMAISMVSVRVLYGRKGGNRIAYTVMGSVCQWS
jgi:transcriptional regulator with XRE-family HTH domain